MPFTTIERLIAENRKDLPKPIELITGEVVVLKRTSTKGIFLSKIGLIQTLSMTLTSCFGPTIPDISDYPTDIAFPLKISENNFTLHNPLNYN